MMDSIRKEIFDFLEKNSKASNNELYKSFPDFNKSSIRIYKKQFLENHDQNITLKQKEDFALLETFLTEINIFPAIIFVKLYWKIKECENQEILDYSVVDLYQELFKEYFLRTDKINEIYDFSFQIYKKIGEVYADINNEVFSSEKAQQYNRVIMRKIWKAIYTCQEIMVNLHGYIFEEETGDRIKFKGSEAIIVYNDTIRYIEAYILSYYIMLESYEKIESLRNRELRYIYRELKKVDFLCYNAFRINGKYIRNSWYYDEKGSTLLEYINRETIKANEFKVGYSNDFEDDMYLEFIEKKDVSPSEWRFIQKRLEVNKQLKEANKQLKEKNFEDFL